MEHGAEVNARDSQGWTPLSWAAFNGHLTNVEFLLEHGADSSAQDVHGWSPLMWAVYSSSAKKLETVKLLLDHQKSHACREHRPEELDAETGNYKRSPPNAIEIAATEGDIEVFELLMAHYTSSKEGCDQLWQSGRFDVPVGNIWRTISKSETINGLEAVIGPGRFATRGTEKQDLKNSFLHLAIQDERLEVVRVLLVLGADANHKTKGRTLLHIASFRRDHRFAESLLRSGADCEALDPEGMTALHQAAITGFVETASTLIEGGSDVNVRIDTAHCPTSQSYPSVDGTPPIDGMTSLMMAYGFRSDHGFWYGQNTSPDPAQLTRTIKPLVELLLNKDADFTLKDNLGRTALHYAAQTGNIELVKQLVEAGADIEARTNDGATPLHFGTSSIELLEYFLDIGASAAVTNDKNKNVLHYLALARRVDDPLDKLQALVTRLLAAGGDNLLSAVTEGDKYEAMFLSTDPPTREQKSMTPLSLALACRKWNLFKIFDKHGAVFPPSFDWVGWLDYSTLSSDPAIIKTLLRHGATPVAGPGLGKPGYCRFVDWYCLMSVVKTVDGTAVKDLMEITDALVNAGFDVDHRPRFVDETLLSIAGRLPSHHDLIQKLLVLGADPELELSDGLTPLLRAAVHSKYEPLQLMLRHIGASKPQVGESESEDVKTITAFCSHLASRGEINQNFGEKTLLDWAVERSNRLLVQGLLSFGADVNTRRQGMNPGPTALQLSLNIYGQKSYRQVDQLTALEIPDLLIQHGADIEGAVDQLTQKLARSIELRNPGLWDRLQSGIINKRKLS